MIKAAVIGAGAMGRNHVRVYAEMENVSLVGVADPDETAAHKATRVYQTRTYADYRRMLDEEQPEIVSIAVPTEHHAEVAEEVMGRGVHVLIEKPLALTAEEGRAIIAGARRHGVKLMMGHIERFNPAIAEIKSRLGRQELGRVFQIVARRLSPFPARIRDVGVTLDLATHDIDVMRYLLGDEVARVYAETDQKAHQKAEDLLSGLVRFRGGVIGVLDINWLTPSKVRQLAVLGEGGMYLADYLTQDVYWYKNARVAGAWDSLSVFRDVWEGDMIKIQIPKKEPLRAELEAFVGVVTERREPPVTGEDGLAALAIAHKLVESGRTHMPAMLDAEQA